MAELNFDELFNEALAEDGETIPTKFEDDPADDAGDVDTGVGGNEGEEDANSDSVVKDATNTEGDTDADTELDYKALYEQEKQRTSSWDGRLKAKDRENEAIKAEAMALKRQVEAATQSRDQQAIDDADESVSTFLSEFPELADPIRKMINSAVKSTRQEIRAEVDRDVTPLRQTVQDSAVEKHFSTITKEHDDFMDVVEAGDLKKWIDAQPSFVRRAYDEVYNGGTATEVIELMDQFRVANPRVDNGEGVVAKKGTVAKHKPTQAVRTRSSGIPTVRKRIEKDDFAGAWEAAINEK